MSESFLLNGIEPELLPDIDLELEAIDEVGVKFSMKQKLNVNNRKFSLAHSFDTQNIKDTIFYDYYLNLLTWQCTYIYKNIVLRIIIMFYCF